MDTCFSGEPQDFLTRLGPEDSGGMLRGGPVHYNQAPGLRVRSPPTLGNGGGDQEVWGGAGDGCRQPRLTVCVNSCGAGVGLMIIKKRNRLL